MKLMPWNAVRIAGAVALAVCLGGVTQSAAARPLSHWDMLSFLVQDVCIDGSGAVVNATPLDPSCQRRRMQTESDPVFWRKHDLPPPLGFEADDSVLARRQGLAIAISTFDFGGGPVRFKVFDPKYDGGDGVFVDNDEAAIFITQDGARPDVIQHFVSPGCRANPIAGYHAWLLFASDLGPEWRSAVRGIQDRDDGGCPDRFQAAYTRYREIRAPVRFHLDGGEVTRVLDMALSEHYAGASMETSQTMERQWFARGFGFVRWERWGKQPPNPNAAIPERCPAFPGSEPPGPDWRLMDCRTWTNIVRDDGSWTVAQFGWPRLPW